MAQRGLDQADVAGLGRVTAELRHRRAKGAPGQSDPADPAPAEPKPKRRRVSTAGIAADTLERFSCYVGHLWTLRGVL